MHSWAEEVRQNQNEMNAATDADAAGSDEDNMEENNNPMWDSESDAGAVGVGGMPTGLLVSPVPYVPEEGLMVRSNRRE